jgi:alanyl-tRNA synthetase
VAAGVRRIEAVTGPKAYELVLERERLLQATQEVLKATPDTVVRKAQSLMDERRALERQLADAMKGGSGEVSRLLSSAAPVDGVRTVASVVAAPDVRTLQALGDALREQPDAIVAALGATFEDRKSALLVVVTDAARARSLRADDVVRELAAAAGGRGGGKPHMAQAGIPDGARLPDALAQLPAVIRAHLARGS